MTGMPNATALVGRAQMQKGPNRSLGLFKFGAGNESRTRDLNLGKVALYQLSYSRVSYQAKPRILYRIFLSVKPVKALKTRVLVGCPALHGYENLQERNYTISLLALSNALRCGVCLRFC